MPTPIPGQDPKTERKRDDVAATAEAVHAAAIHLLRRLRAEDRASGISGPRLSALSVIVFGGPITLGALAEAEQVRPPTISRLVKALEHDGLVRREHDRDDRRVVRVHATAQGRRTLAEGRDRRVSALAHELEALSSEDRSTLARAAALLERLADG